MALTPELQKEKELELQEIHGRLLAFADELAIDSDSDDRYVLVVIEARHAARHIDHLLRMLLLTPTLG